MKIAITTTSFGEYDDTPLKLCKDGGCAVVLNPHNRKIEAGEFLELARDADGVIAGTETITKKMLQSLPSLKVISRCGSGLDSVDLVAARELGIKIYNTPEAPVSAVAELVLCFMLMLLRKISVMDKDVKAGRWKKRMGNLLCGKKVGVAGLGRIGRRVAQLAGAFGAIVSYSDPAVPQEEAVGIHKTGLEELLRDCDIISLNLSCAKNAGVIMGEKEFSLMKKGSFLINCSRGEVLDEDALYLALASGRLAGAAIDVFEKEPYNGRLRELDNIILTPHIGSYATESRVSMEIEAVKNLLLGLKEKSGK